MLRSAPSALAFALLVAGSANVPKAQAPATWTAVRPIIEQRCLPCHGGDQVRGELQLVDADHFQTGGARGELLHGKQPTQGLLWRVTSHENPDLAMPPSGMLPASELAALQAWIRAGAPWPAGSEGRLAAARELHEPEFADGDWWAYEPLTAPPIPQGPPDEHPIDAFVRARLADAQLEPAAAADRTVLLRRLSFSLRGLPPTHAEREAFAAAADAGGFEAAWDDQIEAWLGSVQHGEHLARRWMDLVRFAETNGYERDTTKKNIWRYRDWLIRAFQEDLPFDRFLTWQLAGDEWAAAAKETASANERDEAWLATGYLRLGVWDDEPADREQAYADEIADIVDVTSQVFLATTFGCARCHDHKADPIRQRDYFGFTAAFANLEGYRDKPVRQLADRRSADTLEPQAKKDQLAEVDRRLRSAVEALPQAAKSSLLPPVVLVPSARNAAHEWAFAAEKVPGDWAQPGFDDSGWSRGRASFGTRGTPGALVGTEWKGPAIHLRTTFRLEAIPDGLHLDLHHDDDVEVLLNGQLVFRRSGYVTHYRRFQLGPEALASLVVGRNVLAVRCVQKFGGQNIDLGLTTGVHDEAHAAWRQRLAAALAGSLDGGVREHIEALLTQRAAIERAPVANRYPALVATERGDQAPEQRIHLRGSVHAPGEIAPFGLPDAFVHPGKQGLPAARPVAKKSAGRRLALAQWMVGEGRFLTARVIANRIWQVHFGRGICRSSGDFGRLGERPTHPELLDYLAAWLIEHDWSIHALERHLLTSQTWCATSVASAEAARRDPRNNLWSRFDPRRLSAEEYRDAVLFADGSLNLQSFGPSIFPPMPKEVLATSSRPGKAWGRSTPEEATRRSLYIFTKRSLRMPLLEAFDQPDPDMACPDRFPTNVPTQALMTINGPFVQRAAARLTAALMADEGTPFERLRRGLSRALSRPIPNDEVLRHLAFVKRLRDRHGLSEAAAMHSFAVALFNLNAFFWVD